MLIAVDTNVLIAHANSDENVMDAVAVIKHRTRHARFVVLPTVIEELAALFLNGDTAERAAAESALTNMRLWGFEPLNLIAVKRGIVEQIALTLRLKNIFPEEEVNDSLITSEAALLGCHILLSADSHLLDAQRHPLFRKVLRESDVENEDIVIATPGEIVRKFFPKK